MLYAERKLGASAHVSVEWHAGAALAHHDLDVDGEGAGEGCNETELSGVEGSVVQIAAEPTHMHEGFITMLEVAVNTALTGPNLDRSLLASTKNAREYRIARDAISLIHRSMRALAVL